MRHVTLLPDWEMGVTTGCPMVMRVAGASPMAYGVDRAMPYGKARRAVSKPEPDAVPKPPKMRLPSVKTPGVLDESDHETECVTSCWLPSLKNARAVKEVKIPPAKVAGPRMLKLVNETVRVSRANSPELEVPPSPSTTRVSKLNPALSAASPAR